MSLLLESSDMERWIFIKWIGMMTTRDCYGSNLERFSALWLKVGQKEIIKEMENAEIVHVDTAAQNLWSDTQS